MSRRKKLSLLAVLFAGAAVRAAPAASPWATTVIDYSPGPLQAIGSDADHLTTFNDPSQALGAFDSAATVTQGSTQVVQLGQRGSITLGFDHSILNKVADATSATNPLGTDFTVFGNAFVVGFQGSGKYFREPGFVEVSQKTAGGLPGEWFLLLPPIAPGAMTSANTGIGPLIDGYADVHPVNGSGDPLRSPERSGSAGGDAFQLENAVRETSPGVYQSVKLNYIDFVRITDVLPNDTAGAAGMITTDIDAVADLPGTVPEPATLAVVAIGAWAALRRR